MNGNHEAASFKAVHLSLAAREAWIAWWDAHAEEMCNPALPAVLLGPWGKLRTYAARLALILHYLWLGPEQADRTEVQAETIERAVRLVHYFKSHARAVYQQIGQAPEEKALFALLDWIRREKDGKCTVRDVVRARKATPTIRARGMLEELVARGYYSGSKVPHTRLAAAYCTSGWRK